MRIILAALIIFLSSCQRGDLEISQGGFLSSKELSNEVVKTMITPQTYESLLEAVDI